MVPEVTLHAGLERRGPQLLRQTPMDPGGDDNNNCHNNNNTNTHPVAPHAAELGGRRGLGMHQPTVPCMHVCMSGSVYVHCIESSVRVYLYVCLRARIGGGMWWAGCFLCTVLAAASTSRRRSPRALLCCRVPQHLHTQTMHRNGISCEVHPLTVGYVDTIYDLVRAKRMCGGQPRCDMVTCTRCPPWIENQALCCAMRTLVFLQVSTPPDSCDQTVAVVRWI